MRARDLPLLGAVVEAGPDDRVFDLLLLIGPLLVVSIVLLGRTLLTTGLATAYVLAIPLYVLFKAFG